MIERLQISDWLSFDRDYPAPTFFARPAWALALAQARSALVPAPLRVRIDGRWFILPALRKTGGRLPFKQYEAFPLGGYTCALDENGNVADAATTTRVVCEAARFVDQLRIVVWPLATITRPDGFTGTTHETAVIDCSEGLDSVLAGIRGVTRRMAGQAQRRGVSCGRATDASAVDDYYALLDQAAQGWGLKEPPISKRLLEAVVERGGDDVEIWFAEVDGKRIGGGVVFYGSEELFFWSAAMRREFSEYRPSNALNIALLNAACERGVHWYNLGASEGLPGVERFKRDLGARSITYEALTVSNRGFALYERLRNELKRRMGSQAANQGKGTPIGPPSAGPQPIARD